MYRTAPTKAVTLPTRQMLWQLASGKLDANAANAIHTQHVLSNDLIKSRLDKNTTFLNDADNIDPEHNAHDVSTVMASKPTSQYYLVFSELLLPKSRSVCRR